MGELNLTIRQIYPQSRDGVASQDRINPLQPNISVVNNLMDLPVQSTSSGVPSLRDTVNLQSSTSYRTTPVMPPEPTVGESIRDQVLGDLSTQVGMNDNTSVMTEVKMSMGTELKKAVITPVEEKTEEKVVDLSTVYVSKCTAIVRKSDSTNGKGLRLMDRMKHDYIESLSYVLYQCLFNKQKTLLVSILLYL